MNLIVIIGAGGHGRVVRELVMAAGGFKVIGFLDRGEPGLRNNGVEILGDDSLLPQLCAEGVRHAFVALGENVLREKIGIRLREMGVIQPPLIHPTAFLAPSARVSEGALVMARAVLGTNASLKPFAILNTGAIVDHDGELDVACHVAPGAALAGNVTVGARALVGVGSSVRPGTTIGADAIVGAGSAVVLNVDSGTCVGGVPARVIRRHQ